MIILIVEDDADIQRAYSRFLRLRFQAEVVVAGNVASGLRALQSGPYNLVITDFQLPDGTGAEIVQAVRGLEKRTPVVLSSGQRGLEAVGADAFVPKPADMDEFAAICERLAAA
jgi:DNA-binding response OmpR family regulator